MFLNFEAIYEYLSGTFITSILIVICTSVLTFVVGWMTSRKYAKTNGNNAAKESAEGDDNTDDDVCYNYHGNGNTTDETCSTPEEDNILEKMTDEQINFQNIARHVNVAATAEKMIMSGLSKEQMSEEYSSQQNQLAEIFNLMQNQGEKFGGMSMTMDDMYQQMKLYR